jgi:hypothetical protein
MIPFRKNQLRKIVNKIKKIKKIKLNKIIQLMIFKSIMINSKMIIKKVKRNKYNVN